MTRAGGGIGNQTWKAAGESRTVRESVLMEIMRGDKETGGRFNEFLKNLPHIVMTAALNLLHIVMVVALVVYTFYAVIADGGITAQNFWGEALNCLLLASINDIFTFIGALAFILFGIVGIYEFSYANGLHGLIPPFYLKFREKRDKKNAADMMKAYYEQDLAFIQQYEQERAERILQALGIEEKQFHHIQYELVRARVQPQGTPKEMADKLKPMVYQGDFIIDQSDISRNERIYPHVDYFINLYTALYDPKLCGDVGNIMADYIMWCFSQDEVDYAIDYIVVPFGSNLLLGLEVGRRLQKPVIAVQEKPRILEGQCWDGNYVRKPGGKNHIIMIHDVLVSGNRIWQSVEKLPHDTYVVDGLYCLIQYDHSKNRPKRALRRHGITNVRCLIHTNEQILRRVKKEPQRLEEEDDSL